MQALGKTDFVWCFFLRSIGLIWPVQEIFYSLHLSCATPDTWEDQAFQGWSRRPWVPVPNGLPDYSSPLRSLSAARIEGHGLWGWEGREVWQNLDFAWLLFVQPVSRQPVSFSQ